MERCSTTGRLEAKPKLTDAPAPRRPRRLELSLVPSRKHWRLGGSLRDLRSGARESSPTWALRAQDVAGHVGLHLRGKGKVRVTYLEIRGLLDVERLLGK